MRSRKKSKPFALQLTLANKHHHLYYGQFRVHNLVLRIEIRHLLKSEGSPASLTPYSLPFPPKWGFQKPPIYANGHISATGDPIHFMFCSRVGFSGTADRTALFPVRTNPRWRPPPSWKNFKWPYIRNRSSDPLHVWL